MKLTELRQLIRTILINEIKIVKEDESSYKHDRLIKNPDTGRTIKVSTALGYPKDSTVYKMAVAQTANDDNSPSVSKDDIEAGKRAVARGKVNKEKQSVSFLNIADRKAAEKAIPVKYKNLYKVTGENKIEFNQTAAFKDFIGK